VLRGRQENEKKSGEDRNLGKDQGPGAAKTREAGNRGDEGRQKELFCKSWPEGRKTNLTNKLRVREKQGDAEVILNRAASRTYS